MKKYFSLFLVVALLLSVFTLASCGKKQNNKEEYVVTYYDGETVLKEETVKKGEYASNWTPVVTDKEFLGWYGTPTFSHEFKFNETPITSNTKVFAKFLTVDFVKDNRTWAIVGAGTSRLLAQSSYGKTITDEHKLKSSNKEKVNEFTITLDLLAGDEFQFAINSSWNNQRGAGYLKSFADNTQKCFDVKGSVFSTNTKKSNISVLVDGNYTFTLTTYPNLDYYDTNDSYYTEDNKESFNYSDYDEITWVRNGDPIEASAEVIYDFYIKGQVITGWQQLTDAEYKMTFDEKTRTYTYTHQFFADDQFMFYTFAKDSTDLGPLQIKFGQVDTENSTENLSGDVANDTNIGVTKNGTYTFVYNLDSKKLVVTYDPAFDLDYVVNETWYIAGNGSSALLSESNWGKVIGDKFQLKPVEGAQYTYSITLDLYKNDQFQIVKDDKWALKHGFSFIAEPVKDEIAYFKDSGNICVLVSGNYTLTLICSEEEIAKDSITWVRNGDPVVPEATEERIYEVLAKGTMTENAWEPTAKVRANDNKVSFVFDLKLNDELGFAWFDQDTTSEYGNWIGTSALGTTGAANEIFAGANNFKCSVAGTYKFVIDFSSGDPVVDICAVVYEVLAKGTMTENAWEPTAKLRANNNEVLFEFTLKVGDELGFAWFDQDTTNEYGNWIGTSALGTTGAANEIFAGANNFKCSVAGTYKFIISFINGSPVVNITIVE